MCVLCEECVVCVVCGVCVGYGIIPQVQSTSVAPSLLQSHSRYHLVATS